jgi:hypothetical protein
MIYFKEYLKESVAHDQAQKLKLEYYGFGRYGRNHIVTHINHAGRLIPVKKQFPAKRGEDMLLHYTHVEDQMLEKGVAGARQTLDTLHSAVKNSNNLHIETKVDGAPSCIFGKHNGKFFVATKSFANKNPKINYTPEDIERNHGHAPGLVAKLKAALEHLPKIFKGGDNEIYQGDVMFTKDDVDVRDINGTPHYTFKPNTVRNAIPVNSEDGRKIERSKFGFATHTKYNDNNERLPANSDDTNEHPDIYQFPFSMKGNADTPETQGKLSALGGMLQGTKRETFDYMSQDHIRPLIMQYINAKVRNGSQDDLDASDFIGWVKKYHQKTIDKLKTPSGKEKKQQALDALIDDLTANKAHLNQTFRLHSSMTDLKHSVIDHLDKQQTVKRFFDTKHGIKPTGPEGYVAISTAGTSKLVKRGEFSAANFAQNSGEWGSGNIKEPEKPKAAVVTLGRMSPPHKEHGNLIDAVVQHANDTKADPYVFVTHTQDNKKNPLSANEKMEVLNAAYPEYKGIFHSTNKDNPSIFHVLTGLYNAGYKKVTVVLGDDRTADLESLKKYNGVFKDGKGYKFDDIQVVSRHTIKNTREGTNDGIHASDMRKWAQEDDFKSFKAGMHPNVSSDLIKTIMAKIKDRIK